MVPRSTICNAEASLIMQQSSHGVDRLTQSVLYYPCGSCMDALVGNSIFVWLFLDLGVGREISGSHSWCLWCRTVGLPLIEMNGPALQIGWQQK